MADCAEGEEGIAGDAVANVTGLARLRLQGPSGVDDQRAPQGDHVGIAARQNRRFAPPRPIEIGGRLLDEEHAFAKKELERLRMRQSIAKENHIPGRCLSFAQHG